MATIAANPSMGSSMNGAGVNGGLLMQDNLFLASINNDHIANTVDVLYPQYTMATLRRMMGKSEGIRGPGWKWFEIERTRAFGTVADDGSGDANVSLVGGSPNQVTVVLKETTQSFLRGDVINAPNHRQYRLVTDPTFAGSVQTITLETSNGQAAAVADFNSGGANSEGAILTHLFTRFGEGFTAPAGRNYKFEERTAKFHTMSRTVSVTDREAMNIKQQTLGGKKYWYYQVQMIEHQEMMKDDEVSTLMAQAGPMGDNGIVPLILERGLLANYTGTVQEDDLIDMLTVLEVYAEVKEWLVLCGHLFHRDIAKNLNDSYAVNGGVIFGNFAEKNPAQWARFGKDIKSYCFTGKHLSFKTCEIWQDPLLYPTHTGQRDYRYFAAFINWAYVQLAHRVADNGSSAAHNTFTTTGIVPGSQAQKASYRVAHDTATQKFIVTQYKGQALRKPNNSAAMFKTA